MNNVSEFASNILRNITNWSISTYLSPELTRMQSCVATSCSVCFSDVEIHVLKYKNAAGDQYHAVDNIIDTEQLLANVLCVNFN